MEDLSLGRRYAELGLPVAVLGGGKDVAFRMYGEGVLSLVRGCLRSLGRGTFVLSPARIAGIAVWITLCLRRVPLGGQVVTLARHSTHSYVRGADGCAVP